MSEPPEELPDEPLSIESVTNSVAARAGKKATLTVTLNRAEAAVAYQWQRLVAPTEADPAAQLDGGETPNESAYYLPIAGMTEAQLLALNPEATWPGKEMWEAAVAAADGDTSVHFENGTPIVLDQAVPDWEDIAGATEASYTFTVGESDATTKYRCIVSTSGTSPEKEKAATEAPPSVSNSVAVDSAVVTDSAVVAADTIVSSSTPVDSAPASSAPVDSVQKKMPPESKADTSESDTDLSKGKSSATLLSEEVRVVVEPPFSLFGRSANIPNVTLQDGWLVGVARDMEYITADAYAQHSADAVDNPYWTKLAGGTRANGTTYIAQSLSLKDGQYRMPPLSAWYGKTVYVRRAGHAGKGAEIDVPAYTDTDFTTGKKVLYKKVLSVLSVRVPETGVDFYSTYIDGVTQPTTRELRDGKGTALVYATAPLTPNNGQYPVCFNTNPERYLQDAEGNHRFDSVMLGVNVLAEPDLSGKAAWALKGYMAEGYGIMTGHDMMYGYGGVTSPDYVPDPNSTTTPYYELNTNNNGHWNMNWLMGANKLYTEASPHEAASMVLCSGSWIDKSTLYGDNYGRSTVRVNTMGQGDPDTDATTRCPTNYPYNTLRDPSGVNIPIQPNITIATNATHSNQQLAYGTVWIDFATNSLIDSGCGQLITDTRKSLGLTGTNNFYLTTNGNLALNQIGHRVTGQAAGYAELQLFANTILYISQRQQCQICQSEQGGNKEVHFVHRISSVEELERLKDQDKYWYTYPTDGCYILTSDIVLPPDWSPIENFYGHFHANGYAVTPGTNGAPLFANTTGTLGEYTGTTTRGWNLGTEKEKGINAVANTAGLRATGMARVSGFLGALFNEDNTAWANKIVTIEGTDGVTYSCKTNADGKYVLSNLPCTGVMKAHVYDTGDIAVISPANEVTRYGPIRVNVPDSFWDTDETTVLYLLGFTPIPVENRTVYEGEDAAFVEGGVYYTSPVTNVCWQYKETLSGAWKDIETAPFPYTITPPKFHDKGEDSYTTSAIKVPACKESMSGLYFQAVFTAADGRSTVTSAASTGAKQGKLTVLPRPAYVTQAQDKAVWVDCDASFTSTLEYWKRPEDGLKVAWEYSLNGGRTWSDAAALARSSATHTVSENTNAAHKKLAPWLITYTFDLKGCLTDYERSGGMLLRAVYSYTNDVKTRTWRSSEANKPGYTGKLNVKYPTIEAGAPSYQVLSVNQNSGGQYFAAPGAVDTDTYASGNVAVFTSVITYSPGLVDAMGGEVGVPTIQWQYKDNINGTYRPWTNAEVQKWAARGTGFTAEQVVSTPKKLAGDNQYQVTATLTLKNCPVEMDAGTVHHWFRTIATTQFTNNTAYLSTKAQDTSDGYAYDPDNKAGKASTGADLMLLYSIDIKHNAPNITKGSGYSDWVYPQLEVKAPQGARTVLVQFTNQSFNLNDMVLASSIGAYPQIRIMSGGQYGYVFVSTSGALLPETYWRDFLRSLVWRTYDLQASGGADILWYIDENDWSSYGDIYYNSSNGHFYEYISAPGITWHDAYSAAQSRYFTPLSAYGYLMTITSAGEQEMADKLAQGRYYWLGCTRDTSFTGHGEWTWAWTGGPEKGQAFFQQNPGGSGGSNINGMYSHWDNVSVGGWMEEPNNANSGEAYGHLYDRGYWNDEAHNANNILGYMVEYGSLNDTLKRTNHSAFDTDNIYVHTAGNFSVTITASNKVYDGVEQNAKVVIGNVSGLSDAELNTIASYGVVTYSSGAQTGVINGAAVSGSGCIHAGEYTATVTFPGLPSAYTLSSAESTTQAKFEITPRPVYANGTAVRPYDGTDIASVSGITAQAAGTDTGIIVADAARVRLNRTTATGVYEDGIHQTGGSDVPVNVTLDDDVMLTGDTYSDYILTTSYTGRITPRPLHIHSRYLEEPNKPRNIRAYDGTDAATVRDILLDNVVQGDAVALDKKTFAGTYDSAKAQETLTPEGKTQPQRFLKLGESEIVRTEAIALVNNDFGDYAIASESYSGAIFRKTLEENVPGYTSVYGEIPAYKFEALPEYTKDTMGSKDTLHLAQLAAGDALTIDETQSRFVYPATGMPDKTSDAGFYEVSYEGLTQDNYAVLENYVVEVMSGGVIITPRTVTVTVDGGYHKEVNKKNPSFGVRYHGFVNNDTEKTALSGKLTFETSCETQSPVIFEPDGTTLRGYPIFAQGLTCKENKNGLQNYEIEWIPGDITVYALGLEVKKSADKQIAQVGETITYTLTVKNTSSVPVKNVAVQDENSGAGGIQANSTDDYEYLGGGKFLIPEIARDATVEITYTYTVQKGDEHNVIRNAAVAQIPGDPFDPVKPFDPDAPVDPDHEYPSEDVEVEVLGLEIQKAADKKIVQIGETVTYTLTVKNTSSIPIKNIKVEDNNNGAGEIEARSTGDYQYLGGGKFLIPEIKHKGTVKIQYTYTAQKGDKHNTIRNIAIASIPGDPLDPVYPFNPDAPVDPKHIYPSDEVKVEVLGLEVSKAADKQIAKVGETISYTLTVKNISSIPVKNIKVQDENSGTGEIEVSSSDAYQYLGDGKFLIPEIAHKGIVEIKYTYTVQKGDDHNQIRNAAVAGIPGDPLDPVKPFDPDAPVDPDHEYPSEDVEVEVLGLEIEKVADKKIVQIGETVTYTLTVKNTSSIPIKNIKVEDNNNGAGEIEARSTKDYQYLGGGKFLIPEIKHKGTVKIQYTYTAQKGDKHNTIRNIAIASIPGDPLDPVYPFNPDAPVDPKHIYPSEEVKVEVLGLEVSKAADKQIAKVGETISYTLTVKNISSISVKNIKVQDENSGTGEIEVSSSDAYQYLGDGKFLIPEIAHKGIVEIKYTYTVQKGDDHNQIRNAAVAGIPGDPLDPVKPFDPDAPVDPDHEYPSEDVEVEVLGLEIEKVADKKIVQIGETVTYTLTVKNTSSIPIKNIKVEDNNNGAGQIEARSTGDYQYLGGGKFLIPEIKHKGTVKIQYTYTTQKGDEHNTIRNSAVAVIPGNPLDPTNPFDPSAPVNPDYIYPSKEVLVEVLGLAVKKAADKEIANVGESISYTLTVTNKSSIVLKNIKVQDESSGTGEIEATSTSAYRYLGGGKFLIPEIPHKGTVTIRYTYTARQGDAGTTIRNVAVAQIPGDPLDPVKPFDPDAPVNPDHVYPSEEVKVPVPRLTGTIHVYKPCAPQGEIKGQPIKPFPKTGVTRTKNGKLYREDSFFVPMAETPKITLPETMRDGWKTWKLESTSIARADGLQGDESITVKYDGLREKSVPETYTVENGAVSYCLSLEKVEFEHTDKKTVLVEYKNAPIKPKPPQTLTQEENGELVTYTLERMTRTTPYIWRKTALPTRYYGDIGYRFYAGTAEIPYNAQKPMFEGHEDALLALLNETAATYKFVDSRWTDSAFVTSKNGSRYRRGEYTVQRMAADWEARYAIGEENYRASAVYTANGTKTQIEYLATGIYTAHPSQEAIVLMLLAAAALGVAALIIFTRKRKKG